MAEQFNISPHMTAADFDCPIRNTYLGQAHIAGTGPEGTTCRQCKHWGKTKFVKDEHGNYVEKFAPPQTEWQKAQAVSGRAKRRLLPQAHPQQSKASHPASRVVVPIFRAERKPDAHSHR